MANIQVGGIKIGEGNELVFIAEIGTNYEEDVNVAKELLIHSKKCGAKMAKMECFKTGDVYRIKDMIGKKYRYATAKGEQTEDWMSHVVPKCMDIKVYEEIIDYSKSIDLPIFASVYDIEMMDKVVEMGCCAVKIASCNVIHLPLIEHAGKLNIPIFLDTNLSLFHHISQAVITAKKSGVENLILMHNPIGSRPTPPENHNFRAMQLYHDVFDVPVGFACHYRGDEMMYAAVAMGAHAIEKPVSRDPDRIDSEYVFSTHMSDLKDIICKCENVLKARGKSMLEPGDVPEFHIERMSPCAKRKILKGEKLTLENVAFKRPCGSITTDLWYQMEGKIVRVDIEPDDLIQWGHLEIQKIKLDNPFIIDDNSNILKYDKKILEPYVSIISDQLKLNYTLHLENNDHFYGLNANPKNGLIGHYRFKSKNIDYHLSIKPKIEKTTIHLIDIICKKLTQKGIQVPKFCPTNKIKYIQLLQRKPALYLFLTRYVNHSFFDGSKDQFLKVSIK